MKKYDVFNFDLKKIKVFTKKLSDFEKIKFLKHVILEYKIETGVFESEVGVGLRMPRKLSPRSLIHSLEEEIEKCKTKLYFPENISDNAAHIFDEALSMIDDVLNTIKSDSKLKTSYISQLNDRIHALVE